MRRGWVPVAAVVIVVAGLSLWLGFRSTTPATTTTAVASTTTTGSSSTAVWPLPASGLRYLTPAAAATGFASGLLHWSAPVVGPFRQGDTRSGEVPVRGSSRGPETTVLVRQLTGDGSWWVIGAVTANIALTSPAALSVVTSPLSLKGSSVAFEGVVNVTLRDDLSATPLAATTVMGGGAQLAPFVKTVTFSAPASSYGDLVLYERSARDGSVTCATVVRVRF